MSYWCDDAKLNREQRRLDAMQAEAERKMARQPSPPDVAATLRTLMATSKGDPDDIRPFIYPANLASPQ
jgi:hypothetical protein